MFRTRVYEDSKENLPTNVNYIDPTSLTITSSATATEDQFCCGMLITNPGTSAGTLYTPTAKQLIARIKGIRVGEGFKTTIRNIGTSSGAVTVTAPTGGGVTVTGAVIAATAIRDFLIVPTNITNGSEAVTVYGLATSAY